MRNTNHGIRVSLRSSLTCALLCEEIFEKWRVVDTAKVSPEKQEEFEEDKQESNRRYNAAFDQVLLHTTDAELNAFWAEFGSQSHTMEGMRAALQPQNNPMHETHVSRQSASHSHSYTDTNGAEAVVNQAPGKDNEQNRVV